MITRILSYIFFLISLVSFYFSGKYFYLNYYGGQLIKRQSEVIIPHAQIPEEELNEENVSDQENTNLAENKATNLTEDNFKDEALELEKKKIFRIIEEFLLNNPEFIKKIVQEQTQEHNRTDK